MQYRFEDFEINEFDFVGKGTYGDVCRCKLKSQPSLKVVVKICAIQIDQREIDILNQLAQSVYCNENIVKVYCICTNNKKVYIFMEECEMDLNTMLKERKFVNEQEALHIIKNISQGYYTLYQEKVIHRDIKPANVLINNNIYKLSDFGEGKVMKNLIEQLQQTKRGTPAYQSPQLLSCFEEKAKATNKLDMFSLGLIFYQLIVGELPYNYPVNLKTINQFNFEIEKTPFDFYKSLANKLSRVEPPLISKGTPEISQKVAELINKMLQHKEENRISWEDFFNHELISIKQQKRLKSESSQQSTIDSYGNAKHQKQGSPVQVQKQKLTTNKITPQPIVIDKPKIQKFQTNLAFLNQNQNQNLHQGQHQNQIQNNISPVQIQKPTINKIGKEILEFVNKFKLKAAELEFLPLFKQVPFLEGPFKVKDYLIKNQAEFQRYLPYSPKQTYTLHHLYIVTCFYKIIRNEEIAEGESFNNEANLIKYLNSLSNQ